MCAFFSCIVTKNGDVLFDEMSDRHEDIVDRYKASFDLSDTTTDEENLKFARIEIIPPNGDYFVDPKMWVLRVDEMIKPSWFTKTDEKNCRKVFKEFYKNHVLIGKEIAELSENRYWIKDCKIKYVGGSAVIKYVRDRAVIQYVGGRAGIQYVGDSAVIKVFSKNAKYTLKDDAICISAVGDVPVIKVANKNIKIEVVK